MLHFDGIKCWVTTSNNTILPVYSVAGDNSPVPTCTIKLPSSKKSYVIHWCSSAPITAWCVVSTKNAFGKTTEGVVKCEMDASKPETQNHSTQGYNGTGRNLSFNGRRPINSPNLGMTWLEIRRATSIEVDEISTRERKLTIHWISSDRPESGTPYVTFLFNFELSDKLETTENGVPSSPVASPSISRTLRGSSIEDQIVVTDSPRSPQSPGFIVNEDIPEIPQEIDPVVINGTESTPEVAKAPRVVVEDLPDPDLPHEPPVDFVEQPNSPVSSCTYSGVVISSVNGSQKRPLEEVEEALLDELPEPKRLRSTTIDIEQPDTPESDDPIPDLLVDVSDEELDDFDPKSESLEKEIESMIKNMKFLAEKAGYVEVKRKKIQSVQDIKALESICGMLPSRRPVVENWDQLNEEAPKEETELLRERLHIEAALPNLEGYVSALKSKKTYLERKAKLKRLRADFDALEQRVTEISADIKEMLSKTPANTPVKNRRQVI